MQPECAGGEPPITPMHFPGHTDDSKQCPNEIGPKRKKPPRQCRDGFFRFMRGSRIACVLNRKEVSVLGRPGSDLLFQVLRLSTIGAGKFDGRVRDGIGYRLPANTTRSAKDE